jgi:hypothetical protein
MIALVSTIIGISVTPMLPLQSTYAAIEDGAQRGSTSSKKAAAALSNDQEPQDRSPAERKCPCPKAPIATSGNNIYIAWWTNKTGNDEVMFRASSDGGKTFGDKINLSNTTKSESQDAHIDASGDRVFVTWWERNATSEEPPLRTSTDMGATFGPIMKLSTNGTIGSSGGG